MSRRGIALVAALSLLSLLGLLVAGAVAAAMIAQRTARLGVADATLSADADYAIGVVLADPYGYALADLPLGAAHTIHVSAPSADGVSLVVSATRLPSNLLWLVASASADEGARRVNLVARFAVAGPLAVSPLVARGSIIVAGDVSVTADTTGDADCRTSAAPSPLQTADSLVLFQTARQLALLDSAAGVLRVRGDTTITGGSFSGMLLVDGSLSIEGPFSLTGAAIAGGSVHVSGGAAIRFSPCTIARVLRAAAPPRPVRGRTWADLF